jgi:hypothetical protein
MGLPARIGEPQNLRGLVDNHKVQLYHQRGIITMGHQTRFAATVNAAVE